MSYFIFNDYRSDTDLIITQPMIRPSWSQEMSEITTGSVSKIIRLSRTFGNTQMTISTVIPEVTRERLNRIYAGIRGYGELVLSSAQDEYMYAVANVLTPRAVAMRTAELEVSFTLLPFAYAVQPTIVPLTHDFVEIVNNGTVLSAPLIRFTPSGAGDVNIDTNGKTFVVRVPESLTGKKITVDCNNEITYYINDGNFVSINQLTYSDYPLLHEGSNYAKYRGNVTSMELNVRERWY